VSGPARCSWASALGMGGVNQDGWNQKLRFSFSHVVFLSFIILGHVLTSISNDTYVSFDLLLVHLLFALVDPPLLTTFGLTFK